MHLFNVSIYGFNAAQVIALLQALKKNITDNVTVFLNSTAILTQIDGVLTPLIAANGAVVENESLAKSLTAAQQAAVLACAPVVKAVGDYGEGVCEGDPVKAALLGLPLSKQNATHLPVTLVKPTGFSVTTSETPGELDTQTDTMNGAHGWEVEASPDPMTATFWPVLFFGRSGVIQPSANARSMICNSICLMFTARSFSASVQAASQGAGQTRPVMSGKLFVDCRLAAASRQRW